MAINVCSYFLNADILAKILEIYLGQIPGWIPEAKFYGTQIFFIKLNKDVEYAAAFILCFNVYTTKDKLQAWEKITAVGNNSLFSLT
jgi:hypothetical protein